MSGNIYYGHNPSKCHPLQPSYYVRESGLFGWEVVKGYYSAPGNIPVAGPFWTKRQALRAQEAIVQQWHDGFVFGTHIHEAADPPVSA